MKSISCLSDAFETVILDSSVVVNLNATGYADRILLSLPGNVLIPNAVIGELERGTLAGYTDATDLRELLDQKIVQKLPLSKPAQTEFVALVSGATVGSLGDGEAATIASAHTTGAWAVIDERKARRICQERYGSINLASTVDVLSHTDVVDAFTADEFSTAIFAALEVARMQVQPGHMDWIIRHVDPEKLDHCVSLPRAIRLAAKAI